MIKQSSSLVASRSVRRNWDLLPYAAPAFIVLSALAAFPIYRLLKMSVSNVTIQNINGIWENVGLENFKRVLRDPDFVNILTNTFVFVGIVTFFGLLLGFIAANVFHDEARTSDFLIAFMVFIWALPPIVNGSVWKFLLGGDGVVNVLMQKANLINESIPFLYDPTLALYSVAFVNCWAVIPFNALVLKASFKSVSKEVLEASQIDGVTTLQQIRYVYFPHSLPTLLVLSILTVVYAFRSFDFIYVMTYGGPGVATNTVPFKGYINALVKFDFSGGAALAVISIFFTSSLAFFYARNVRTEEQI